MDEQVERVQRLLDLFIVGLNDQPPARSRSNYMKAEHLSTIHCVSDIDYDSPHFAEPEVPSSADDLEEVAAKLLQIADDWGAKNVRQFKNSMQQPALQGRFRSDGVAQTSSLSPELEATCEMLANIFRTEGDKLDQNKARELCMPLCEQVPNYIDVMQTFELVLPRREPQERMAALFSLTAMCSRIRDYTVQYVVGVIGVSSIPDTVLF